MSHLLCLLQPDNEPWLVLSVNGKLASWKVLHALYFINLSQPLLQYEKLHKSCFRRHESLDLMAELQVPAFIYQAGEPHVACTIMRVPMLYFISVHKKPHQVLLSSPALLYTSPPETSMLSNGLKNTVLNCQLADLSDNLGILLVKDSSEHTGSTHTHPHLIALPVGERMGNQVLESNGISHHLLPCWFLINENEFVSSLQPGQNSAACKRVSSGKTCLSAARVDKMK